MREQAIHQKVGGRAGLASRRSGAIAQKPARRGSRGDSAKNFGERIRLLAGYFPLFMKVVLAIAVGVVVFAGYRAAASATFFQVRHVEVKGAARASSEQVQQVVRRELAKSGVWRADLTAVSAQLERLPWVRTAVVTRLLPDGIRVRLDERVQRAVVRTAAGRLVWVDDDAVALGETSPADQMPAFFMRGWSEENSEEAREDNRERVQKYLELTRDWDAVAVSERVSEVNLLDLHDIRVQLAGDDSEIEVRLGSKDAGPRLQKALRVLDAQRGTPRGGFISYVDLTQSRRAVVGFTSGRQISDAQPGDDGDVPEPAAKPETRTAKPAAKETAKPARATNRPRTD